MDKLINNHNTCFQNEGVVPNQLVEEQFYEWDCFLVLTEPLLSIGSPTTLNIDPSLFTIGTEIGIPY
jgi:hypothetical protein